jgi:hypothetical protein
MKMEADFQVQGKRSEENNDVFSLTYPHCHVIPHWRLITTALEIREDLPHPPSSTMP